MKLPKSVLIKETPSLFLGKYNYKIVIVCPASGWFRSKNYDLTQAKLDEVKSKHFGDKWFKIRNAKELKYCFEILNTLKSFEDAEYDIRVESPLISLYTNNTSYIEKLASISEDNVKFVCLPNKNLQHLEPGKVVVKKLDYDYKVYLATIKKRDHSSFLNWAENNSKIRLTKRCIKDLKQVVSWGGSYFYVKDNKTLTMVKMFLGGDISKVEQVIKA